MGIYTLRTSRRPLGGASLSSMFWLERAFGDPLHWNAAIRTCGSAHGSFGDSGYFTMPIGPSVASFLDLRFLLLRCSGWTRTLANARVAVHAVLAVEDYKYHAAALIALGYDDEEQGRYKASRQGPKFARPLLASCPLERRQHLLRKCEAYAIAALFKFVSRSLEPTPRASLPAVDKRQCALRRLQKSCGAINSVSL